MAEKDVNLIDEMVTRDLKRPARILVIGDAMTDRYINGRTESCQEGCQKFMEESRADVPGGAHNAARSISHWYAKVTCPYLSDAYGLGGPIKTRFMIDGKCVFRYDCDTIRFDLNVMRDEAIRILKGWQPEGVLLSDYDKGLLTPEFIKQVVSICKENSIPCVADAKREPGLYRGAIIKGNAVYFHKYAEQARTMTSQAISTNGRYVPVVWDRGKASTPVVTQEVPCVNHVGAGDCFAAHLTLALSYGFSLNDAAAIAHCAGRCYVQRPYNEPPSIEDMRRDYARKDEKGLGVPPG